MGRPVRWSPLVSAAMLATCGAFLAFGCASQTGPATAGTVLIDARPVTITPAALDGLSLLGTVVLDADHPQFGGFSGLLVDGRHMTAISDEGWILRADVTDGPKGLRPGRARIEPMTEGGATLDKAGGDAESLAMVDGRLAVAFERDHRIAFLDGDRLTDTIRDRRFESLGSNRGLEALTTLPDGRLLAIAEAPEANGYPVFVIRPGRGIAEGRLPQVGEHFVTGADTGPDGRLYVLKRHFSLIEGLSIRVERYRIGPDGFPLAATREELAAFESASGIDNMEGIAVWREGAATRLALISDDNFGAVQRTLLMTFEVTG